MKKDMSQELFGLQTDFESSEVIIMPVPWEVTTSYGGGTSAGPNAILKASPQVDLFDVEHGTAHEMGYHLLPEDTWFREKNAALCELSSLIIKEWDENLENGSMANEHLGEINSGTTEMVAKVKWQTQKILQAGKIPGIIGGDHSSPLGAIQAISEQLDGNFGILHIDAHADLRHKYQGFKHSHASIMRNIMALPKAPELLVQVGIRDFCAEEWEYICEHESQIHTYFDHQLKSALFSGSTWHDLCEDLIEDLPENVYISFDVDGLSPEFCPGTGTPVPGGLSYDQAIHLLSLLGHSGRRVVGFDLCEVAPQGESEWDGNVGARLLFKLCGWSVVTNGHYEIG